MGGTHHIRRLLRLLVPLTMAALVALPSSASAEIRSVSVSDPADATPTISGVPNTPDIRQVDVVYDSAGAISFTVSFHHAVNQLDTSQIYAFYSTFSVGAAASSTDPGLGCALGGPGSIASGQHHVFANSTTFYDRSTVTGFSGDLVYARSVSADNTQVTIAASSPVLANRDYRCLTYYSKARRRSTVEHPYSRYDESCDCWYLDVYLDEVGEGPDYRKFFWFNGFRPVPPPPSPPPPPVVKSPAKTKVTVGVRPRARCGVINLSDYTVRDASPAEYSGRLKFSVARAGLIRRRSINVDVSPRVVFRRLRPGAYRVTMHYTGDAARARSNVVRKLVRLTRCTKPRKRSKR
jgi:hypothetical protein